jgi:YebC/PmpR family DNA-binding regulatory protein
MSGHSKWHSIKHKKGLADAKRGKMFSKYIKAITIAARLGGPDINSNPRLRTAVDTAKEGNMPGDTIERAIKKGAGTLEGQQIEQSYYEGYGPGGVALYIEVLSDNKNRAASSVRAILNRGNGKLGGAGSTSYIFQNKGILEVDKAGQSEDKVMELALDAGAEDIKDIGEAWSVISDTAAFEKVKKALQDAKIPFKGAALTLIPNMTTPISVEDGRKLFKLMADLEEDEDVQNVYANFEMSDADLAEATKE